MTRPWKGTGKATTWFPVEGHSTCKKRESRPEEVSQEKKREKYSIKDMVTFMHICGCAYIYIQYTGWFESRFTVVHVEINTIINK